MAIPKYEQQIEPEGIQATAPEELHPVAAAFGGDIGAALEKSGDQVANRIEQLSRHMSQMNYYRQQQNVADKTLQMSTDQNPVLYSEDPKEITRNPAIDTLKPTDLSLSAGGAAPSDIEPVAGARTFTVPTGLLLRKDSAAYGATEEYHDWYTNYSKQMVDQARAEGMGPRAIRSLKVRMDANFASNARYISAHEAKEINNGQIKTFTSLMQADADSSNLAQDPQSLGLKIDSINKSAIDLSSSQELHKNPDGTLTDAHVNTANKFVVQALDNAGTTNLKLSNGDPAEFQGILDKLHNDGRINDTQYNIAQKHLGASSRAMISQNQALAKMQTVNVRMDAFSKIGQGKFDISNQGLIDEYAAKDPELGNALQTIAESKGQYKPERNDAQNREFQKSVTAMINSSSQDQLSSYMSKMLSSKNGMSQTHLNIMVNALLNHSKTLPVIDGQPNSPITQNTSAMAFNALDDWANRSNLSSEEKTDAITHYLNGMANNVPPKQNYDNAVRNHIITKYPSTSVMATPPNLVIDKYNDIKYIFPRTNRKENGTNANSK